MNNLDAMARAQGYPDYATMNAFMQRQSAGYRSNNGATNAPGGQPGGPQSQARPVAPATDPNANYLGGPVGALMSHIANMWPK